MFGYALWDEATDWFRRHPGTQRPLVYDNMPQLLAARAQLLRDGVPPEEAQPVELLEQAAALRRIPLDNVGLNAAAP